MEKVIKEVFIPASHGAGFEVRKGQYFQLIDIEGQQVADMIAICKANNKEVFSPAHTRSCQNDTTIKVGDCLFSNMRNPLLKITQDTVGKHDLVVPCCDIWRYIRDYGITDHRNCQDNIIEGLEMVGMKYERLDVPEAINIFMNNVVTEDGKIVTKEPTHKAGSMIEFEVLEDLVVSISACPQDLSPCNAYNPTSMKVLVLEKE